MSARTRALDQVGRMVGEVPLDTLFIVHRRRWYWSSVALGFALALGVSVAVGAPWLLALPIAGVGAGLGTNVGSDFRFIARTPTRLLLLASSRVIARPTSVLKELHDVALTGRGLARTLLLDGEAHQMAAGQARRLDRMRDAYDADDRFVPDPLPAP